MNVKLKDFSDVIIELNGVSISMHTATSSILYKRLKSILVETEYIESIPCNRCVPTNLCSLGFNCRCENAPCFLEKNFDFSENTNARQKL
ncbi:MAG: hypothetical protein EHM12_11225 [Dehalococcoidia bacterium]|nr:MAG: hypothetical protein EHM12_11225 [Dehalococcoidia bacterium]